MLNHFSCFVGVEHFVFICLMSFQHYINTLFVAILDLNTRNILLLVLSNFIMLYLFLFNQTWWNISI